MRSLKRLQVAGGAPFSHAFWAMGLLTFMTVFAFPKEKVGVIIGKNFHGMALVGLDFAIWMIRLTRHWSNHNLAQPNPDISAADS